MEQKELKETCEKLRDALKRENGGHMDEYPGFDELERRSEHYALFLALCHFLEREF